MISSSTMFCLMSEISLGGTVWKQNQFYTTHPQHIHDVTVAKFWTVQINMWRRIQKKSYYIMY